MRIDGFVFQLSVTNNHEGTIRKAASSFLTLKGMTGLDIILHKLAITSTIECNMHLFSPCECTQEVQV
jgi:hypothetical protein